MPAVHPLPVLLCRSMGPTKPKELGPGENWLDTSLLK